MALGKDTELDSLCPFMRSSEKAQDKPGSQKNQYAKVSYIPPHNQQNSVQRSWENQSHFWLPQNKTEIDLIKEVKKYLYTEK